jgi:hypothetical protein
VFPVRYELNFVLKTALPCRCHGDMVFLVRYGLHFVIYRDLLFRRTQLLAARVEAGPNTSSVALRVIGGDEKGTRCLGV